MIGFLTKLRIEFIQLLSILIITGSAFGSEINQKFELPEMIDTLIRYKEKGRMQEEA